jgi:hypothetical protein
MEDPMHLTHPSTRSSRSFLWGGFLAACALSFGVQAAEAHELTAALATPDCGANSIELRFTGQYMLNGPFSVPYSIDFNCTDGGPAIPSINDTANGIVSNNPPNMLAGTFDITVTHAAPLAGRTCDISGSATLFQDGVQYNTVVLTDGAGATSIPVACTPEVISGCTPGYWKQRQHFDSWVAYSPGDSFESVFGRDVPGTPSLLDALRGRGGGLVALMRHATAALLNTSNAGVSYPYSTAEVVHLFQNAFDSGDYETTKNLFAGLNETGCPLN